MAKRGRKTVYGFGQVGLELFTLGDKNYMYRRVTKNEKQLVEREWFARHGIPYGCIVCRMPESVVQLTVAHLHAEQCKGVCGDTSCTRDSRTMGTGGTFPRREWDNIVLCICKECNLRMGNRHAKDVFTKPVYKFLVKLASLLPSQTQELAARQEAFERTKQIIELRGLREIAFSQVRVPFYIP